MVGGFCFLLVLNTTLYFRKLQEVLCCFFQNKVNKDWLSDTNNIQTPPPRKPINFVKLDIFILYGGVLIW